MKKLAPKILKSKNKDKRRHCAADIYYKVMGFLLVKPHSFIESILIKRLERKINESHVEYQGKVVKEVVKHIQQRLSYHGVTISMDSDDDDITLKEFVGYSFRSRKLNKLSRKYYSYYLSKLKGEDKDKDYAEIFESVLDYFRQFEDVEVSPEEYYGRKCWLIKIKG